MSIKRTKSKTKTKNECSKNKKQTKNQKRTLKKQKAKQRPKKKKQLLEKNNNLFPDFRSIYYFPLTLRQLRFSGIHYKQSACLLFNKWTPKDMARESQLFCICYNSKTKQKPMTKIQGRVFLLHWRPHAKIQALWWNFFFHPNRHLAWFCAHPFNYGYSLHIITIYFCLLLFFSSPQATKQALLFYQTA